MDSVTVPGAEVREVLCRQALSPCGIPGFSYSLNPYTGCQHGCVYCYARFMCKYRKGGRNGRWGSFVDVKVNMPEVLEKEMKRKKPGRIFFCSVTDGYQLIERRYGISRKVLEILARHRFPVSILTKSALIERDIDVLSRIRKLEVGFTVTLPDDRDRRIFEPLTSPTQERLRVLKKLSETGIRTYAFLGPFLPGLSDKGLEGFIREIAGTGISCLMLDRLNVKYGNWRSIEPVLRKHYPELLPEYKEIFFGKSGYYKELKTRVQKLCKENGLELEVCY